MKQLLLKNCSQLLTIKDKASDCIGLKKDCSVLIEGEHIKKVDSFVNLKEFIQTENVIVVDCEDKVVMPGYVDSHTHLVFGHSRVEEYCLKLTKSAEETKRLLGRVGLDSSIYSTKNSTEEELIKSSLEKLNRMLHFGTTTVEIKSGYGIDLETEIKTLRVIKKLGEISNQNIFATYLGAHYWDINMGKEKYIDFMIKEVMPIVKEENLAQFCDVWCDDGYYTAEESEKVLSAGKIYGMLPTLHTECYSAIGGAKVAAKLRAVNVGHLNYLTREDAETLAEAKVVGILIPGTDFSVKHKKPFDVEVLKKAKMDIALATNLNPGNWIESMQMTLQLACRNHSMTPEEAIMAATLGGAKALKIEKSLGSIEEGKIADIQILNTNDYRNIVYKIGINQVENVIKSGKIIF